MKKYLAAALFSAISATSVQAIENQKTVCTHGNQTRVIEVVYTTEDNIPCEVRYSKNESSQVLWSATNLAGYCEEKAAALVEKQKNWGWACESSTNTETADETEIMATEEAPVSTELEAPAESAAIIIEDADSVEPVTTEK